MSEMSVEVQVGSVVVDAASVAHASRHKHGGLDPIATETPGAYAIPKADATGKLAAGFIPMGLISGGISTLDDLSDGSSYKRIAAAVATALNANTYTANDASKVSAFGIGVYTVPVMTGDTDNYLTGGFYKDPGNLPHSAWPGVNIATILVVPHSPTLAMQFAFYAGSSIIKFRAYTGSVWEAWNQIYTSGATGSDGNGGQPPAPKPLGDDTLNSIGSTISLDLANGAQSIPGSTGSIYWEVQTVGATWGGSYTGRSNAGLSPGNITGGPARVKFWRVA